MGGAANSAYLLHLHESDVCDERDLRWLPVRAHQSYLGLRALDVKRDGVCEVEWTTSPLTVGATPRSTSKTQTYDTSPFEATMSDYN